MEWDFFSQEDFTIKLLNESTRTLHNTHKEVKIFAFLNGTRKKKLSQTPEAKQKFLRYSYCEVFEFSPSLSTEVFFTVEIAVYLIQLQISAVNMSFHKGKRTIKCMESFFKR